MNMARLQQTALINLTFLKTSLAKCQVRFLEGKQKCLSSLKSTKFMQIRNNETKVEAKLFSKKKKKHSRIIASYTDY